jgi:CheY-like chemotaxis protein
MPDASSRELDVTIFPVRDLSGGIINYAALERDVTHERRLQESVRQWQKMEALEIFRPEPDEFDVVITDQTMPYMTGEKLAQEMLRIRPDIPIILCTGFSEVIEEEDAKALGIREFILKPFSIAEIAERIQKALKRP